MSVESRIKRTARRHKMVTHDGMIASGRFIKTLDRGILPVTPKPTEGIFSRLKHLLHSILKKLKVVKDGRKD